MAPASRARRSSSDGRPPSARASARSVSSSTRSASPPSQRASARAAATGPRISSSSARMPMSRTSSSAGQGSPSPRRAWSTPSDQERAEAAVRQRAARAREVLVGDGRRLGPAAVVERDACLPAAQVRVPGEQIVLVAERAAGLKIRQRRVVVAHMVRGRHEVAVADRRVAVQSHLERELQAARSFSRPSANLVGASRPPHVADRDDQHLSLAEALGERRSPSAPIRARPRDRSPSWQGVARWAYARASSRLGGSDSRISMAVVPCSRTRGPSPWYHANSESQRCASPSRSRSPVAP